MLDVDAVLGRLAGEDATAAEVARHRFFAGLSVDEAALAMGVSRATAFREWAYARSWLATCCRTRPMDGGLVLVRAHPHGRQQTITIMIQTGHL